jgi:hypothetical protein
VGRGDEGRIAYVTEGLGAAMIALLLGLIGRTAAVYRRASSGEVDDYMMVDVKEEEAG